MDNSDQIKKLAQDRFGKYAQGYVTSQTHSAQSELDILGSFAEAQPGWRTLDIATGGGHTSLYFASRVKSVMAVDLTEGMLKAARNHHASKGATNIHYASSDAESLPFPAESFDLVTCRIAAHHFPNVAEFVKEGARVLRKGARFVFQDQVVPDDSQAAELVNDFERKRDPSHHIAYDRESWVRFFEMAGLAVFEQELISKKHNFLNWAQMQSCSQETIEALAGMALRLSPIAKEWLQPENFPDAASATFQNRHLVLLARKD
jgi:ubiquinone/menaquinone biosynthesis C-methylase UbiE